MEDELSHYQDHQNEDDLSESEIEESKHDHPQKRKQNFWTWSFSTHSRKRLPPTMYLLFRTLMLEPLKSLKRSKEVIFFWLYFLWNFKVCVHDVSSRVSS